MRKLAVALLLFISSIGLFGQDRFIWKWKPNNLGGGQGIYDCRAERWVNISCEYDELGPMYETYQGHTYFWYKESGRYGVLDETGRVVIRAVWDGILKSYDGFIPVKKNGDWGIIDVYNNQVVKCQYKTIDISYGGYVKIYSWDGGLQQLTTKDLMNIRNEILAAKRAEEVRKAREESERRQREKKERELASFTEYARNYVEPKINEWQKKGEFEKLSDYQRRVTGPNRSAMIDRYTLEAEKQFIAENAAMKPETAQMFLDVYDSENEVFHIKSEKLGNLIVPVPIADGPDFKKHFALLQRRNPVFYIDNDKIALASMDFFDPVSKKKYSYSNRNALNYNHYEIDADKYTFELVNVVSAQPVVQTASSVSAKKPVITILSPEKNSQYFTSSVTVRYQAKVFDGSTPTLHVWINGIESTGTQKEDGVADKGVAPAYQEVELTLPKEKEHQCNIMLSVTDGSGFSSENKTLTLFYAGDAPKPTLHIFSVGVSDYASSSLTKLNFAAKDAADFVKTITSSDLSMYDKVASPVTLTDKAATKAAIERGLSQLVRDVEQDDVVMLFFSGHGVKDGDDTYFMSVDADGDEPYSGVDFALIKKSLTKMTDKKCRVLVFMDACHSGAMYSAKSALKNITFADNDIIGYYSSTANQTSAEFKGDENGIFTKALIEGLRGKAKNSDGEITTLGLQQYISDYVSKKTNGRQSPIVENKQGNIVLYNVKK